MATVALLVHHRRHDADVQAKEFIAWLTDGGHSVRLLADDAAEYGLADAAVDSDVLCHDTDLMVALGGDGSMLRAVEFAAKFNVPVLGVNFGTLGYLTEVEPEAMREAVEMALQGRAPIEQRMRIMANIERADGSCEPAVHALNEAVVEKVDSGRTVHLSVTIDGEFFTTYSADGVIVATPTGSTAYSLSARGPIIAPTHEALIVTAVAPHMLFDRSLVLAPDSEVRVEVASDRSAALNVDGRIISHLDAGDAVVCKRSILPGRFVAIRDHDFLHVLKSKFGLNER